MDEAYEHKSLTYIAAEAELCGWRTQVLPMEIRLEVLKLLKSMGVQDQAHQQAVKLLLKAVERSRNWLWIKRKDPIWATTCQM